MAKRKIKKPIKASIRAKKAFIAVVENGRSVSAAMREAGYSKATSTHPSKLTRQKSWQSLMDEYLPDRMLAKKHQELLGATGIGHMVFPMATTDEEIRNLLESVNCTPKKIQRGDQATHVWFWQRDNKAIKDGLDLAYRLKGSYAPEKKEISGGLSLSALFDGSLDDHEKGDT